MSGNAFCHFEIPTGDAKKSSDFYARLFGWKMSTDMGEEYILYQPAEGPGGAISQNENFTPNTSMVAYIYVDDIDNYLKKAVELGGKELTAKTQIPGHGWYGKFSDLDGNVMGLFTAASNN